MRGIAIGTATVGVALLVWFATPIRWDGLVESGANGPVYGMALVALVFGTVSGVLAGLLGRRWMRAGHTSAGADAAIAFLTLSLVALWPMTLSVAMFPATEEAPTNSSRVFETCVAWLAYVALAYLLYRILSCRALRQRRVGPAPRRLSG